MYCTRLGSQFHTWRSGGCIALGWVHSFILAGTQVSEMCCWVPCKI